MTQKKPLPNYDDFLEQYPDWILLRADLYHQHETVYETEKARLRALARIGHVLKFLQDNGLTRRMICATAPDIPHDLKVYLRDVTPEALDLYRSGYLKWLTRFERNADADPSDMKVLEKELVKLKNSKASNPG